MHIKSMKKQAPSTKYMITMNLNRNNCSEVPYKKKKDPVISFCDY